MQDLLDNYRFFVAYCGELWYIIDVGFRGKKKKRYKHFKQKGASMKNKNMDKYDKILKNVKTRIEIDILSGYQFCLPGETEIARRDIKGYCSQHNEKYPGVAPCIDCSLSNYGRDCHNLEIVDFLNK